MTSPFSASSSSSSSRRSILRGMSGLEEQRKIIGIDTSKRTHREEKARESEVIVCGANIVGIDSLAGTCYNDIYNTKHRDEGTLETRTKI